MKETNPLTSIITWLTGKHKMYELYATHSDQFHSLKKPEKTLLPYKLFDIKSIIKRNSLGIPLYLRAK